MWPGSSNRVGPSSPCWLCCVGVSRWVMVADEVGSKDWMQLGVPHQRWDLPLPTKTSSTRHRSGVDCGWQGSVGHQGPHVQEGSGQRVHYHLQQPVQLELQHPRHPDFRTSTSAMWRCFGSVICICSDLNLRSWSFCPILGQHASRCRCWRQRSLRNPRCQQLCSDILHT